MKEANFRKSLSLGFIVSMVLLSLRSLGNPHQINKLETQHTGTFNIVICYGVGKR